LIELWQARWQWISARPKPALAGASRGSNIINYGIDLYNLISIM